MLQENAENGWVNSNKEVSKQRLRNFLLKIIWKAMYGVRMGQKDKY